MPLLGLQICVSCTLHGLVDKVIRSCCGIVVGAAWFACCAARWVRKRTLGYFILSCNPHFWESKAEPFELFHPSLSMGLRFCQPAPKSPKSQTSRESRFRFDGPLSCLLRSKATLCFYRLGIGATQSCGLYTDPERFRRGIILVDMGVSHSSGALENAVGRRRGKNSNQLDPGGNSMFQGSRRVFSSEEQIFTVSQNWLWRSVLIRLSSSVLVKCGSACEQREASRQAFRTPPYRGAPVGLTEVRGVSSATWAARSQKSQWQVLELSSF